MDRNLNTVKTAPAKSGSYHHGDLRKALIDAAVSIIRERGLDGFSLREAARRAGVSPAAPQHHFGDMRGLMTAIATEGFRGLCEAMTAAAATSEKPYDRVRNIGEAYVRFALAEPARFDVMWRAAKIDREDAAYKEAAERAFEILQDEVSPGEQHRKDDPRAIAAWSIVHGFARLALDGAFGTEPGAAEAATDGLIKPMLDLLKV